MTVAAAAVAAAAGLAELDVFGSAPSLSEAFQGVLKDSLHKEVLVVP